MADIDIDPFGEHDKTDSHPDETGENIPHTPGGESSWEPEREQEMSFGGRTSLRMEVLREQDKGLYQQLSESIGQNPEVLHYSYFEIREGRLYYENMNKPLTTKGGISRSASEIADILGKKGLCALGFSIPRSKLMARQAILQNRVKEKLPSASDIAKMNDIELQEITENASRSSENLIEQLKGESSEDVPMHELLGLDKQLGSIRGSLRVEVVKKVQLEECIEREKHKLEEIRDNPEYDDGIREDIRCRISKLNDDLSVRQRKH